MWTPHCALPMAEQRPASPGRRQWLAAAGASGLAGWGAPPALKFVLVLAAGTALSFGLGAGLRRLPGAQRVL